MKDFLKTIDQNLIDKAMSYTEYRDLLDRLFSNGKTTGNNHSEAMLNYAKLNIQRMNRLDKKIVISEGLHNLVEAYKGPSMIWLILTEGWCGDAAQNLPMLNKVEQLSSKIELRFILRDERLDIMDKFLTNGGRSIPKLIALRRDNLEVIGTWGPRPKPAQDMLVAFKKQVNGNYEEFNKSLQLWYAKDKTNTMQQEFIDLLSEWNNSKQ